MHPTCVYVFFVFFVFVFYRCCGQWNRPFAARHPGVKKKKKKEKRKNHLKSKRRFSLLGGYNI